MRITSLVRSHAVAQASGPAPLNHASAPVAGSTFEAGQRGPVSLGYSLQGGQPESGGSFRVMGGGLVSQTGTGGGALRAEARAAALRQVFSGFAQALAERLMSTIVGLAPKPPEASSPTDPLKAALQRLGNDAPSAVRTEADQTTAQSFGAADPRAVLEFAMRLYQCAAVLSGGDPQAVGPIFNAIVTRLQQRVGAESGPVASGTPGPVAAGSTTAATVSSAAVASAAAPTAHAAAAGSASGVFVAATPSELSAARDASLKRISDRAISLGLSQQSYNQLMLRAGAETNHRGTMDLVGADPKLPQGYSYPTPEVDQHLEAVETATRRWGAKNGGETDPIVTRYETYAAVDRLTQTGA